MTNLIPKKTLLIVVVLAVVIFAAWQGLTRPKNRMFFRNADTAATMPSSAGMPVFQYALTEESAAGRAGFGGDMKMVLSPTSSIMPMPPMYEGGGQTAAEVDQKIIKTGDLQLAVESTSGCAKRITDIATAHNGFVQSSSFSERADGSRAGSITIRVPSSDFEKAMAEIKELASLVRNESISGQDVTEQYTDLEARLKSAKAQEETFLAILKQSKSVEDTPKVQDRLGAIRSEIESYQGRIKYLENATSYSTISVYVEEDVTVRAPTGEFRLGTILKEASQALVRLFQTLITLVIWLVIIAVGLMVPVLLFAWLIVWLAMKLFRRFWKP